MIFALLGILGLPTIPGFEAFSNIAWVAVIGGALWYYELPIGIAILIMFYQWLCNIDLATTTGSALNSIASIIAKNPIMANISILPKSANPDTSYDNKVEWLKINTPTKIFLNINRAFLYVAFFFSILTLFPFSSIMTFPAIISVYMFDMMTIVILQLEPLALVIIVIIIAPLQKAVSVAAKLIKFVSV